MARKSIGSAIARAGGWGKKAKRKKASKKRSSKKRGSKKRGSKKRSSVNKPKARRSVSKARARKKGSKRRASTTTFKTSGVKLKMKCSPGRAAVARSAKARIGNKTYIVSSGRCVPVYK
jgi:hypothetical protein